MSELASDSSNNLFQDILKAAMHVPGVRINRREFLKKSLSKHYPEQVVNKALEFNPAKAGITSKELDRIAKACINFETSKVTTISAVAGVPGKFGMLVTVPADMTQYFAHVARVLQKLIYLYGWQDIFNNEDGIDDETLNLLTIFIGVMFGVNAANVLVQKLAVNAAARANKVIAAKPLTKGIIYPIVKKIALRISGQINKKIFAGGVSKIIPIIGAITSGGLTFMTFRPLANRLKKHLISLPIADVNFYNDKSKLEIDEIVIDVEDFQEEDFDITD